MLHQLHLVRAHLHAVARMYAMCTRALDIGNSKQIMKHRIRSHSMRATFMHGCEMLLYLATSRE